MDQGRAEAKAARLYKHSVSKDPEFIKYMFAVAYVESSFRSAAMSTANARGLMQLTFVAVVDAMEHCGLSALDSIDRLHDNATNVRYGTCYLRKLITQNNGDWVKALITYNGGYRQLWKYEAGDKIAKETSEYVTKVKKARSLCLTGVKQEPTPGSKYEYVAN